MQIIEHCSGNGYEQLGRFVMPHLASVIIPSHDHAAYIEQAVQSVVQQTYRPIEVLFLDDGSCDDTYLLGLKALQASDLPFLAIRKQNQGSCVSGINNGLMLSHGEFVSILASDDLYYPDKLRASIAKLQDSDALLVLAQDISMREDGCVIAGTETNIDLFRARYEEGRLLEHLYLRKESLQFPYLGLVFRREAFDVLGYYDPGILTEDLDMLFSVASSGIEIAFLSQVVGAHRTGVHSVQYWLRVCESSERVFRKYAPSFWSSNKALAYTQIHKAMAWWKLDKKQAWPFLFLGLVRYPPTAGYVLSNLARLLNRAVRNAIKE